MSNSILKIKDERGMEKLSQKLAKKLEKMSPEQRELFVHKLNYKIKKIDAKLVGIKRSARGLNDAYEDYDEFPLSDSEQFYLVIGCCLGTAVASGLTAGLLTNNVGYGILAGLAGIFAGRGLSYGVGYAIDKKTFPRLFAKLKQSTLEKKFDKALAERKAEQAKLNLATEIIK